MDADGLPAIGSQLNYGDPDLCVWDKTLNKAKLQSFKDHEAARIETIRLLGDEKDPK